MSNFWGAYQLWSIPLVFMYLNIGRIDEVIYKYFCAVLGQTQPRDVCPKYE